MTFMTLDHIMELQQRYYETVNALMFQPPVLHPADTCEEQQTSVVYRWLLHLKSIEAASRQGSCLEDYIIGKITAGIDWLTE